MGSAFAKILTILIGVGTVATSTFVLEQAWRSDTAFQIKSMDDDDSPVVGTDDQDDEEEAGSEEASRAPASTTINPAGSLVLSLEQTFANVLDDKSQAHSLMMRLDLELFDDSNRMLIEERQGVLRSIIIETAREQSYEQLGTLEGKVYFKELLVSKMNESLQAPAIRDVHFSAFYMQ